jgi:hypothetical protein
VSLRADFLAFDDSLTAPGVPPLTSWWREGIGEWLDAYENGHVLELWACVGRGASKSTALYKLALFFALFGDFAIPPGEVHFAIVLSRLKEEASKGIAIIARWLTLLGIRYRLAGDAIELADSNRGIRVCAASVAAASGWRAFFVGRDERSKWATEGAETLDADEIDTSAVAMTATHPFAPTVTAGSAWGMFGTFFEAVTGGTTADRHVLGPAPTWIAAPHISEADCRRKERDARRFAREYACEFQASVCAAFDMNAVDAAFARSIDGMVSRSPVLICDPASGGGDAFTYAAARYVWRATRQWLTRRTHVHGAGWVTSYENDEHGRRIPNPNYQPGDDRPVMRIERFGEFAGGFWGKVSGAQIADEIARFAKANGITHGYGDQREALFLTSAFAARGITYCPITWTNVSKPAAVERVREWMRDGALSLEPNEALRRELLTFEERVLPSGQLSFAARRSAHDDRVALLVSTAMAEIEGVFAASPVTGRRFSPMYERAAQWHRANPGYQMKGE